MSGAVKITFIGDSSNLKKTLGEINRQVAGTESSFGKLQNRFSAARGPALAFSAALGVATAGVVAFGLSSVKAYQESVEASKKLETNLLNVKGNTMGNVKAIQKMAAALQKKGVIEDDAIIAGASQLATFNLQGKTIQKLTPKIADMVAQLKGHNATAEDMVKVNNLIGKVMTGNVGALSKYGVTLNDVQKEQIKNSDEAQRAATIVEVLGQNYGKVNEALRKTPQGRITALKNRFGDLKETVGEFIALKVFEPITKALDKFFDKIDEKGGPFKALKKVAQDNSAAFSAFAGVGLTLLTLGFAALGVSIWTALAPLLPFIAAGAALGLIADQVAKSMGGWDVVFGKIAPHLSDIWGSVQRFIDGDFSKGLFGFDENSGLVKFAKAVRQGFIDLHDAFNEYILPIFEDVKRKIREELMPALADMGITSDDLKTILKDLAIVIGVSILVGFGMAAAACWILVEAVTLVVKFVGLLTKAWSWLIEGLGGKDLIFESLADAFKIIVLPITIAINLFRSLGDAISNVWEVMKKIGGFLGKGGKVGANVMWKVFSGQWMTDGFAMGGAVGAGQPIKVGEGGGPEMFVPNTSGTILNARQTRSLGGTYNVTMNIQKTELTQRDVMVALQRLESLHAA